MADTNNDQQNSEQKDDVDYELERIRLRRMQKIMQMKKQQEIKEQNVVSIDQKIESVLKVIMMPDAYAYYHGMEQRNIDLYKQVKQALLPPQVLSQIDSLIMYLSRGMLRRGIISLTDVQYLERQVLGIGPSITIKKRNQESKSLSSFLKDDS